MLVFHIINGVGRPPVAISGLANAPDIDEILFAQLEMDFGVRVQLHTFTLHVNSWHMGVSIEAELGELVTEASHRIELVGDVTPVPRSVESGVNDGEVPHLSHEFVGQEPVALFLGELVAGPFEGMTGEMVESFQLGVPGGFLVMIAPDHGASQIPHDPQAFTGIGIVTDDITDADIVGALLSLRVGKHCLQCFQIGVDVSKNCKFHYRRGSGKGNGRLGAKQNDSLQGSTGTLIGNGCHSFFTPREPSRFHRIAILRRQKPFHHQGGGPTDHV